MHATSRGLTMSIGQNNSPESVATHQAARKLGVSPRTLEKWRITGDGPPFIKVGRRVVYRQCDLDEWLQAHRRLSTSDAG